MLSSLAKEVLSILVTLEQAPSLEAIAAFGSRLHGGKDSFVVLGYPFLNFPVQVKLAKQ